MNNFKLSICIPTYNRVECLQTCLESITRQFAEPSVLESVEVVISDNASTDATESVVSSFEKKFPNIRYVKNPENLGYDRNALQVVAAASGEFVWLLGDDDALFPDALSYIVPFLAGGTYAYCIVNCWGYDKTLQTPALRQPNLHMEADKYFSRLSDFVRTLPQKDLVGYFGGMSMQIFRRQLWQDVSQQEQHIGTQTIHLFMLLTAMKNEPFALVAKPLVKVRADNIRWDVFPGLETFQKRAWVTMQTKLWILKQYGLPHSEFLLLVEYYFSMCRSWSIYFLRSVVFRSQRSRNFIKKLLGKL